jgi:DNA-binding GntR family transcriptional regulator
MQNGAAVARPSRAPPDSIIPDLLYRYEVCTVLEGHAVYRAALSTTCDLRTARALLACLNQVMLAADLGGWNRLHLEFHRALNDQSGNLVLAAMVERMHLELQALYLPYLSAADGLERLWTLQSEHRKILSCIENRQAEEGMQHTRAHLAGLRDQVVAVLGGRVAATR